MDNREDISVFVSELDAQRAAMGMSYQDVADACDVSRPTVYRALSGKTQPTMQLLKNIAAAVQYKEKRDDILPDELTQEAYIAYLKQLVKQKDDDIDVRAKQLHAHYAKLLRQSKRRVTMWAVLALVFMATFVILFLCDFSHLDRGWIQAAYSHYQSVANHVALAVKDWLGGWLWSV